MTTIRLAPSTGALRLVNAEGVQLGIRGPSLAVILTPVGRPGVGVPTGGASGAMLYKTGTADYATAWLATTAYGRANLAWADAAAGRSSLSVYSIAQVDAGFQPLDSDLTAIAALSTTAYGRSLLGLADAAAGRSLLGVGASDSPTFAGLTSTDTIWATNGVIQTIVSYGGSTGNIGTNSSHALALITAGSERVNISTGGVATFYGTAPGTPGAGEVRIGAGKINAASDIETATKFRVNGSDQPISTVSLVNVNANSTYDLLTIGDNEMWSLAIGNATDGYMVHAVFGKPSASAGAVMPTNDNTSADLTVALVGNVLRISNGIGATRTMIYTLTKLR